MNSNVRTKSEPSWNQRPGFTSAIDAEIYAPFNGLNEMQMRQLVTEFIEETGLDDYHTYFLKGALLAQSDEAFEGARDDGLCLTSTEQTCVEQELTSRWKQPWALWRLVTLCAVGAAVQGWDEAAVDGAQVYYVYPFGIDKDVPLRLATLRGFVNSAPYLCCAFSCWLTKPLNAVLGRRGTIALACIFSASFCLGQAFSNSWHVLLGFRFLLGLGIGPKSATIPVYAAECAPANIRGALVMMWQVFTAFGIMCGYFASAAFRGVLDGDNHDRCAHEAKQSVLLSISCSLNWRLMLASPLVAPIFLAMYIYTQPESPRWLLAKAHQASSAGLDSKAKEYYTRVFTGLASLRLSKLQAACDVILIHYMLLKEDEVLVRGRDGSSWYQRGIYELFAKRRNRRAITASLICMFFQQFCGINVIIYYSSTILTKTYLFTPQKALFLSMGYGIINFVFALPAFYTIDTFGRRNLLLATFPFLAIFQLLNAVSTRLSPGNAQKGLAIAGMYLFSIAYSLGAGPVPFVYAAESMPLYIRDLGMGLVTAVNWLFNFVIAISWPTFVIAFTPSHHIPQGFGAFMWYFAWCIIGWVLIFFFVPETKGLELEELDAVFDESTRKYLSFRWHEAMWFIQRYILRQHQQPRPRFKAERRQNQE